ncbi:MAG: 1-deoxy-D-xylulose-5-phosphate synthase [Bacilli bacterium]|nr:1-deoxy-D-xylulose-5-phosphate synthase [Bacilli bacterium]
MEKSNLNINDIKEIKSPDFLRALNYAGLTDLSRLVRDNIINVTSARGGHLSSNLGVVDLTIALHRNFDFKKDKLIFDVGHQAYTHKILTGRDISSLRQKGGVSGFVKTSESPYDIFEAGHSSTSLSAAYAYALDRDNKDQHYNVVTLIGDASIANGVAFEALNHIPSSDHKVIIVLNDNEMAISSSVGGLSNIFRNLQTSRSYIFVKKGFRKVLRLIKPLYRLAAKIKNWIKRHLIAINLFDAMGFVYIGVVDGHDFKAMDRAFNKAKKTPSSVIIHVRTIKGKGYPLAEQDKDGYWHGVAPFNKETGKPTAYHPDKISWSNVYHDLLINQLKNDKQFYLICPGTLMGSNLEDVAKLYPDRVIDTGIAEEHAVIVASNLAKLNYHVAVSIYSTFMQRAFDQISHDVARIHSPVVFLVDRSGLVGADGETHQGIYDEAFLMSTPNVNVMMASQINDAGAIFNQALKNKEATFIRYPRSLVRKIEPTNVKYKGYEVVKRGHKACVIGVGPLMRELSEAIKDLPVDSIVLFQLKPLEESLIKQLLTYQKIVIYTPYETSEGVGATLIRELTLRGFKHAIFLKAVPTTFIPQASITEQLAASGLSIKQMKEYIKKNLCVTK